MENSQQICEALGYISSTCPRGEWFRTLCAIKSELNNGYEIALNWSKTSSQFNQQDFDDTWRSIQENGGITAATLFQQAYKNGLPLPEKSDEGSSNSTAIASESQVPENNKDTPALKEQRVQAYWESLNPFTTPESNPYLQKNQLTDKLDGLNLRCGHNKDGAFFAYPLMSGGAVKGVARIWENGDKKLAQDSQKSGNAFIIGKLDKPEFVCVCESFSDGVHIYRCTKFPTFVANDAGNLRHVTKRIREVFPKTKIIICADNDQPGLDGAKHATGKNTAIAIPKHKDFCEDVINGENIGDVIHQAGNSIVVDDPQKDSQEKKGTSQNEIALAIAQEHSKKLAFDTDSEEWRSYKDGIWQEIKPLKVQHAVQLMLNREYLTNYNLTFVRGITGLLQGYVSVIKWDADTNLVPFKNGVLNLEKQELTPHNPSHYITWQLPYDYDPSATCTPILNWLFEACGHSQQTVNLIRAFFNSVLCGRAYLQRFVEIIGYGGTGKGTVMRLLISMIGEQNIYSTNLSSLEQNRFEVAALEGKRLVTISDAEKYGGDASVLKAVTGQDWLRKEQKHKQQSGSFIFNGMVLLAANESIQFKDLSSGLARRRITIGFNHVVSAAEKRDLDTEFAPYIAGLLNWALSMPTNEVELLMRDTENQVSAAGLGKKTTLIESNSIAAWLNDHVEYCPDHETGVGSLNTIADHVGRVDQFKNSNSWLYPSYCRHCESSGSKAVSLKQFSSRLQDICQNILGLPNVSLNKGRFNGNGNGAYFIGLKLAQGPDFLSIVDFAFLPKQPIENDPFNKLDGSIPF